MMCVFLLQFLMKYLDQLAGKGLSAAIITELVVLNLAWMLVLAVPMGVLVATLMAFGNLASTNDRHSRQRSQPLQNDGPRCNRFRAGLLCDDSF